MNCKKIFNFTGIAQFMLRKLVPLSATMLFAATAHANCPSPDSIMTMYVQNGSFVNDASGTDWRLQFKWADAPKVGDYKDLQLIKIYLTKYEGEVDLKNVTCVYNSKGGPTDDRQKGSSTPQDLYLVKSGNAIYGRSGTKGMLTVSSYIIIYDKADLQLAKWGRNPNDHEGKMYFCSPRDAENFSTQCGGFVFSEERDEQPNSYWNQAYNQCYFGSWGCNGAGRIYPEEMKKIADNPDSSTRPYCAEADCKSEIKLMNDTVEKAAEYIRYCWARTDWQNKKMPLDECAKPTEEWPDYSGLGPEKR